MTPAVISLAFDPTVHLGPLAIRWETLGLGASFFVALVVAARSAVGGSAGGGLRRLRLDDLLYIVVAAMPGAVLGGRLVYALDYLDYYRAQPDALVDPGRGSLSLLGAVIGGAITALCMARLLGAPVRRWLDALAVPLLVAIGLGKVTQLLGGGGQGVPFSGGWAVALQGAGPWLSVAPSVPAHPSQLYEAGWTLGGVVLVLAAGSGPVRRHLPGFTRQAGEWAARQAASEREVAQGTLRFGYRFLLALQWWLVGRVLVAFTWRDAPVAAGLDAEQLAAIAVLLASVLVGLAWALPAARPAPAPDAGEAPDAAEGRGTTGTPRQLDPLDRAGRD